MPRTRFIIPGEQISRVPLLKLVRANKLAAEIYQDFVAWSESGSPHTRSEFSADRKTALLRAALPSAPPIDDWALRYGDASTTVASRCVVEFLNTGEVSCF